MKKIIMAVAAIAMAASMFAADVSAGTQINTSLFNLNGGNISFFKAANGSEDYACPNFSFGISDDKAGGNLVITTKGGGNVPEITTQKIWFKPLDMLKITVGNVGGNLNQETIGWCNTDSGYEGYGFALNLDMSGFGAELGLAPGAGNYWLGLGGGNVALGKMYVKAGYSADFGTINAMFKLNAVGWNQDTMMFGVGYKGAFGPAGIFVNVLGYMNNGFAGVRGEIFADIGLDGGIGIKVFLPVTFVMNGANMFNTDGNNWHNGGIGYGGAPADNSLILGTILRVSFPVGNFGGYIQVESNNWLGGFSMTITPCLSGNVGCVGWEAQLKATIGAGSVGIDVPVAFKLNF